MARHSAKHAKRRSAPRWAIPKTNWIVVAAVGGACILLLAFGVYVSRGGLRRPQGTTQRASAQTVSTRLATGTVESSATPVEVPTLVGLKLDEAKLMLNAAGLTAVVRREGPGRSAEPTISSQDPAPGGLARTGTVVTVALPEVSSAKKAAATSKPKKTSFVVCIDPGHQSHTDSKTEPLGPGSAVRKQRITGGTTGVVTGAPEYETVLQISTNLKRRLEAAGVTVVMTRTTNDVNLSNAERAQLANAGGANLLVRLHADSNTDGTLSGVYTLYPTSATWTAPIAARSQQAATVMQSAVVKKTRAVDRGVAERGDLAGFNFSTVPAVLVAVGYPSNRVEDRLLVSPNYQDLLAQGLADGILSYLKTQR
jgi:N-acetylmuramoyl-L-alanine amidase